MSEHHMQSTNDRIVEINGFRPPVIQNIDHTRRNLICKSNKFQQIINERLGNINTKDYQYSPILFKLYSQCINELDDIEIIKINGYY